MDTYQETLLSDVEFFVRNIFSNEINQYFIFHNIEHTIDVVKAVRQIAASSSLKNDEYFSVVTAAWFHDTGFSSHIIEDHEKKSQIIAEKFLQTKVDESIIVNILRCIQATKLPQHPSGLIEKIICDADLYHLGTDKFFYFSMRLKKEMEQYFNKVIPDEEWRQKNIQFLQSHKYFTKYCQSYLEPVKQIWLQQLQNNQ